MLNHFIGGNDGQKEGNGHEGHEGEGGEHGNHEGDGNDNEGHEGDRHEHDNHDGQEGPEHGDEDHKVSMNVEMIDSVMYSASNLLNSSMLET